MFHFAISKLNFFLVDFFDVIAAKAWRISNKSVAVLAEGLKVFLDQFEIVSKDSCLTTVSAAPGTAKPCVITLNSVRSGFWIAYHVANIVSSLHVISSPLSII